MSLALTATLQVVALAGIAPGAPLCLASMNQCNPSASGRGLVAPDDDVGGELV